VKHQWKKSSRLLFSHLYCFHYPYW